jgi:hypothetical protein
MGFAAVGPGCQESGLRSGLSKALQRKDFHPVHDRGQVMTDVAVALAYGATNVAAAARMLADAQIVCGPAASPATVWRSSTISPGPRWLG